MKFETGLELCGRQPAALQKRDDYFLRVGGLSYFCINPILSSIFPISGFIFDDNPDLH